MEFQNYNTMYDLVKSNLPRRTSVTSVYQRVVGALYPRIDNQLSYANVRDAQQILLAIAENSWYYEIRPYFKVYPAITRALCKLKLNVHLVDIPVENRVLLIRFARDMGPVSSMGSRINSILAHYRTQGQLTASYVRTLRELGIEDPIAGKKTVFTRTEFTPATSGDKFTMSLLQEEVDTIEHCMKHGVTYDLDNPCGADPAKASDPSLRELSMRIVLSVAILANDPEFVKPDVLAADRLIYNQTGHNKYVERAKRRGIVGWNVGERFESIPHYRRPHLGVRLTGHGRQTPKIVPIKGSVVHRSKMTKVPTGHIMPDGTEVEK